jgi:hypothetical protein
MAVVTTPPSEAERPWTEAEIVRALVEFGQPLDRSKNFEAVPNLSHAMLSYEADLMVCSKAGFLTEVEVKVSATDWKNDAKKQKWRVVAGDRVPRTKLVKRFFYAAPLKLAQRWPEFGIPAHAGVYGVERDRYGRRVFTRLRDAKTLPDFRRLTDREMADFVRLAAVRFWGAQGTIEHLRDDNARLRAQVKAVRDALRRHQEKIGPLC